MRPEVEKYLSEYEEKRTKEKEAAEEKKRLAEKAKRAQTLIRLGLYEKGRVEVTKDDYYDEVQKIDSVKHYYRLDQKIALDVTDEEYEAILKTLPETEKGESDEYSEENRAQSGAATFFSAIAYITWIFGFIAAVAVAAVSESPLMFLIYAVAFFFAGAINLCAAEHFKKLAQIHQEIRKISEKMDR